MKIKKSCLRIAILACFLLLTGCNKRQETSLQLAPLPQESVENDDIQGGESKEQTDLKIYVDVCGAVYTPGVYELPGDARVFQAIEAAGGMTEAADGNYVNRAAPLEDGMQLRILSVDEVSAMQEAAMNPIEGHGASDANTVEASGKININTASAEELKTLSGIGEARAAAILAYREKNGYFQSIEQLQEIDGIKGKMFEKIQDDITVE